MPDYQYVWLLWSSAFLVPWAVLYFTWPALRSHMLRVSAATCLLGATEPIFVPEYWNPPGLFDLAQRTGFDIESFVFCFAIGGMGSILYDALGRREPRPLPQAERDLARHRLHALALAARRQTPCAERRGTAYLFEYWPLVLLAACPLLHLLHGHGSHGGKNEEDGKR